MERYGLLKTGHLNNGCVVNQVWPQNHVQEGFAQTTISQYLKLKEKNKNRKH